MRDMTHSAKPVDLVPTLRPRVFIPHMPMMRSKTTAELVPRIDLAPAEAFGELVFLLDWPEIRDMNLPVIYRKLASRLASYTSDDYILLAGNPAATVIVAMVAAELTDGRVRLLNWNRGGKSIAGMPAGSSGTGGYYEEVYVDIADAAKFLPALDLPADD